MALTFPDPPRAFPRAPFPLIAVIAPLVAAVVIGAIIRSPYVLVFAALSPIIAVASAIESRRVARRQSRDESARFAAECDATERAIGEAHRIETQKAFVAGSDERGTPIGAAPGLSSIVGAAPSVDAHPDRAVRDRLHALHARAAQNSRLPVRVPPGPVEVRGSGLVAERLRARLVQHSEFERQSADQKATIVTVSDLAHLEIAYADGNRVWADAVVPYLADEQARRDHARASALPDRCAWSTVAGGSSGPGLAVGWATTGAVALDLVADGPHVLVGGATGSGKSEFLRALALSASADQGAWSIVYVDFKGGATFHDLAELPSTVGVITDLDASLATRALTSLRAEIERRERVLAHERVRDIAHLESGLSRLLIVVDEYAALVQAHPELQAVFSDISARGRSLGIHLVLCTQRPSGVVHDSVAVNCAIRVLFRTSDASDARALLGGDAPPVSSIPRGRAVVATSDRVFALQGCLVEPADIAAVAHSSVTVPHERPWAPVLPRELSPTHTEVVAARRRARREGSLLIGLGDDVAAQRWSAALWDPGRDGALAVLGCPGSGRSTLLAQLAAEACDAGWRVTCLPATLPDAQQVLTELIRDSLSLTAQPRLLVADDLTTMLESEAPDRAAAFLAHVDSALRTLHQQGGGAAIDLGTASNAGRLLAGRFGARVQLRALDVDDHHAAGGPRGAHNDRAPAGRGWWRGQLTHVIHCARPLPAPDCPSIRTVGRESVIAVVSPNPDAALDNLRASSATRVQPVELTQFAAAAQGHGASSGVLACIAHPDDWQRDWAALSSARRVALTVFDGCDSSDLRALVSARIQPPPIDRHDLWVVDPGQNSTPEVTRARWASRGAGQSTPAGG